MTARILKAFVFLIVLSGCASKHASNAPGNEFRDFAGNREELDKALNRRAILNDDEMIVALAFSGGGTRASAFGFGALKAISETTIPFGNKEEPLIGRVDYVSGVSGGAVNAAYFGLKGPEMLLEGGEFDFRDRYLVQDVEAHLRTDVTIRNLTNALAEGINKKNVFRKWLDKNLFHYATMKDILSENPPRVFINATDIFHGTPFVFGELEFALICSDITKFPVSEAVAASAAVPVVFAPIVLQNHATRCDVEMPNWLTLASKSDEFPTLQKYTESIIAYRENKNIKFLKLLDGGIVDNLGLDFFTIVLEQSKLLSRLHEICARGEQSTKACPRNEPYRPLSREEAIKLRRGIFIVVNSGATISGNWTRTRRGPEITDLVRASLDSALQASSRKGLASFRITLDDWVKRLKDWRCSLGRREVEDVLSGRGASDNWARNRGGGCADVTVYISEIALSQLEDDAMRKRLSSIETRLTLKTKDVDALIEAGRSLLQENKSYKLFLRDMQ